MKFVLKVVVRAETKHGFELDNRLARIYSKSNRKLGFFSIFANRTENRHFVVATLFCLYFDETEKFSKRGHESYSSGSRERAPVNSQFLKNSRIFESQRYQI